MGTVLASAVIADARRLLQDESNAAQRWTDPTLLALLNEAQLTVASLLPTSSASTTVVTLTASARQILPADALAFLGVNSNMLSDGVTPTSVVMPTTVEELNATNPTWRSPMVGITQVLRAAQDPNDVYAYYVAPPVSGGKIELQYAKVPATIASLASVITLHDRFRTAFAHFITYKALEQDSDAAGSQQLMQGHQQKFFSLILGVQPKKEADAETGKTRSR